MITTKALRDVLSKGCNPDTRCEEDRGRTLLHVCVCEALKLGNTSKVKLLLEFKANPDIMDNTDIGKSPLVECIEENNLKIARLLLRHGADINLRSPKQIVPLHEAVVKDHLEMTQLLLLYKASVNAGEQFDRSPIFYASSEAMCRLLVDNGADMCHISIKNETCLHLAARHGCGPAARFFLDRGMQPDFKDSRDYTPLHIASFKGHNHIVQLLLDFGADCKAKTKHGQNPMDIADAKDNMDLAFYMYCRHTGSNKADWRERLQNPLFLFLSAILGTSFYLSRDVVKDVIRDLMSY